MTNAFSIEVDGVFGQFRVLLDFSENDCFEFIEVAFENFEEVEDVHSLVPHERQFIVLGFELVDNGNNHFLNVMEQRVFGDGEHFEEGRVLIHEDVDIFLDDFSPGNEFFIGHDNSDRGDKSW